MLYVNSDTDLQQKIKEAMHRAVDTSIVDLEEQAAFSRSGKGSTQPVKSEGFLTAKYFHDTSRISTSDKNVSIPDPQLHIHTLIANIGVDEHGNTRTLESKNIFKWQMVAGAKFQAALADELRQMGLEIEADGRGSFGIKGIPDELCDHFSKRAQEINANLEEAGLDSSASKAGEKFKLFDRQVKTKFQKSELYQQWQAECAELGFTKEQLNALFQQAPSPDIANPLVEEGEKYDSAILDKAFIKGEDGSYRWAQAPEYKAFTINKNELKLHSKSAFAIHAAIEAAKEKGWSELKLSGTKQFKREAWLQAQLAGFEVKGYRPKEADYKALKELQERQEKQAKLFNNEFVDTEPTIINKERLLHELTENNAAFREQDLYRDAYRQAIEKGLSPAEAKEAVSEILEDENCIFLTQENGDRLYTTKHQIEIEQEWEKTALAMSMNTAHELTDKEIDAAILKKEQATAAEIKTNSGKDVEIKMSDEQRAAVRHACKNGLAIQQGSAGAGKSFSAEALAIAYKKRNYEVIGACVGKLQAQNLAHEAKITTFTIAKLIKDLELGDRKLTDKDMIIVDEAGMVSVRDQQILLKHAHEAGAKIVLTGEDKQLDAVSHAGGLRYLSREDKIGTARIENIFRQNEEWHRQAVTNLRDGRATEAVSEYEDRGLINIEEDAAAQKTQLVKDWYQYHKDNPGKDSMIIAFRWADVKELSEEVRSIYQKEGKVGNEDIEITCSVAGKEMDFKYSTGDRIKFCRNDEKGLGVINGTIGTIKEIQQLPDGDTRFVVETDDRGTIEFKASDYLDQKTNNLNVALAYALTAQACQGATVNGDVFNLYDAKAQGRKQAYVTGSRAKDNTRWYCNGKQLEELAKSRNKKLADLPDDQEVPREGLLKELSQRMSYDRTRKMAIEYLEDAEMASLQKEARNELKSENGLATKNMIRFAEKLAAKNNVQLPDDFRSDFNACQQFIEQNTKTKDSKPTPGMVTFALSVSKEKNLELPNGWRESYELTRAFLNDYSGKELDDQTLGDKDKNLNADISETESEDNELDDAPHEDDYLADPDNEIHEYMDYGEFDELDVPQPDPIDYITERIADLEDSAIRLDRQQEEAIEQLDNLNFASRDAYDLAVADAADEFGLKIKASFDEVTDLRREREVLIELRDGKQPSQELIRLAEDVARKNKLTLPEDYKNNFKSCKDSINDCNSYISSNEPHKHKTKSHTRDELEL